MNLHSTIATVVAMLGVAAPGMSVTPYDMNESADHQALFAATWDQEAQTRLGEAVRWASGSIRLELRGGLDSESVNRAWASDGSSTDRPVRERRENVAPGFVLSAPKAHTGRDRLSNGRGPKQKLLPGMSSVRRELPSDPMLQDPIPTDSVDPTFDPAYPRDTELAKAVIGEGLWAIGLPYQWGGGGLTGPSMGDGSGGAIDGFDCSGLVRFAYFAGTDGAITLPRTSQQQFRVSQQVPMDEVQPGDLLFGNWQEDGPNHVALYIGGGRMIEAPQTGQLVQISMVRPDMAAARLL